MHQIIAVLVEQQAYCVSVKSILGFRQGSRSALVIELLKKLPHLVVLGFVAFGLNWKPVTQPHTIRRFTSCS
jgi:hypothetical protein